MTIRETRHRHAPCHRFVPNAVYMVTAGIYQKAHLLRSNKAKDIVLEELFRQADAHDWQLQAWAVMSNHYHFVALAPEDADSLEAMLDTLHSTTATAVNTLLDTPGRQVWFQYWDTCITNPRSHLARLNYVHNNPVRHGVVRNAAEYRWCSMKWLLEQDERQREVILSTPMDTVRVPDDF